ncbi:MAG: hypothetical protein WC701_10905 [Kiritimatiellales bacterium]
MAYTPLTDYAMYGMFAFVKKQEESIELLLVDICDKLTEVRELCAFLLEAYEAIGREAGAMNATVVSGGALFARDLNQRFAEIGTLLETAKKQLARPAGK